MWAARAVRFALVAALATSCEKPALPIVVPQSAHGVAWRESEGRRSFQLRVEGPYTGVLDGVHFRNQAHLHNCGRRVAELDAPSLGFAPVGAAQSKLDALVEAPGALPAIDLARTLAILADSDAAHAGRDLRAHLVLQGERQVLKIPTRSDLLHFRGDPAKRHVIVFVVLSQDAPTNHNATDSIWTLRVAPNSDDAKTPEQELRDQSLSQAAAQIASAGDAVTCLLVADVSATFTLQQALDWLEPVLALSPDDLQWVARE
jgi:hypothetical protein